MAVGFCFQGNSNVAPASCRLSRGRPALFCGETPQPQPPGRRRYKWMAVVLQKRESPL